MTRTRRREDDEPECDRLRGERGSGMVAGITFMFAFTFLGLVWLASDVDRGVSNQSAAQSIAFQAARSGAQAAQIESVREGEFTRLNDAEARAAATETAAKLFQSYRVNGSVTSIDVDVDEGKVTVTVAIVDGSTRVSGTGTVRAERVT
jgi:Tfp pilus assembly protein PilX